LHYYIHDFICDRMASSQEDNIEDLGLDFLNQYYKLQQTATQIIVSRNEKTKGGSEINGLLTFKDRTNTIFLAIFCILNSTSLSDILVDYKNNGFSKYRFVTSLLLLASTFLLIRHSEKWYLIWLLPFLLSTVGFYLHTILEERYLKNKIRKIVAQFSFHANEKWIGLTISSLTFRNNSLASYFLQCCQKKGLGILTVGKRSKVTLILEPRSFIAREGDYLTYYNSEESIRKSLDNNSVLRVA
jgi:hypothetical protein